MMKRHRSDVSWLGQMCLEKVNQDYSDTYVPVSMCVVNETCLVHGKIINARNEIMPGIVICLINDERLRDRAMKIVM